MGFRPRYCSTVNVIFVLLFKFWWNVILKSNSYKWPEHIILVISKYSFKRSCYCICVFLCDLVRSCFRLLPTVSVRSCFSLSPTVSCDHSEILYWTKVLFRVFVVRISYNFKFRKSVNWNGQRNVHLQASSLPFYNSSIGGSGQRHTVLRKIPQNTRIAMC